MYAFETGQISENLYLIDLLQFGINRITNVYCYWDGNHAILFDIGTSDNVNHVLRVLRKKLKIPLEKLEAIIPTHYHFDHGGGANKLWRKMQGINPNFKILTTKDTQSKLQHADDHIIGARTTFGKFVGEMNPLSEEEYAKAYQIIELNEPLPFDLPNGYQIKVISTPGHTHDHKSLVIMQHEEVEFIFAGEAAGTYFGHPDLLTIPSSMPPNFHYKNYMDSLAKLKALNPKMMGVCHFGSLQGQLKIRKYIDQHQEYMERMKSAILYAHKINSSTRYIIEHLISEDLGFKHRVGKYYIPYLSTSYFENLFLAVSYAIMVDLGIKEPKYEKPAK